MNKRLILFSFLVCIFILVACKENKETINFLSDSNCSPPCMYDIIPGKSTVNDIKSIITTIPKIHDIVWNGPWSTYSEILYFKFQRSGQECEITFTDHIVDHILLYQKLNINIGQIIEIYGEPQTILISNQKRGSTKVLQVNLLYPQKGIVLSYQINPYIKSLSIAPNNNLDYIIFLKPDSFQQFVLSSPLIGQVTEKNLLNHQIDWKGFTTYTITE